MSNYEIETNAKNADGFFVLKRISVFRIPAEQKIL